MRPRLLFADDNGTIYDHPYLEMLGCSGNALVRPEPTALVALPDMSRLYFHPGCAPYAWDPRHNKIVLLDRTTIGRRRVRCSAVSTFIQQGWVRLLLPAMQYGGNKETLPMWAYSAVGLDGESYCAPAFEIDDNFRWNPDTFDDRDLLPQVHRISKQYAGNRLVRHLERCATQYHCFAAKNFFMRRWEAPMPTSPACNAGCIGCISLQPSQSCPAPQSRIDFVPTLEEIVEPFTDHLLNAADPIISFGQGCEGEPLLQGDLLCRAVFAIRQRTDAGTINLNTNGSMPSMIARLADSGLDSIRISINSARADLYERYYSPRGYGFQDVCDSIRDASCLGLFTMINYLVFPGITDEQAELDALCRLIEYARPHLLHFKNLNIDPDMYLKRMGAGAGPGIGIERVRDLLAEKFPALRFGYFNRTRQAFYPAAL
jgi:wyosine [tRNA(Phe)-imidazoG37] synthetase (radical SAM superfamily)